MAVSMHTPLQCTHLEERGDERARCAIEVVILAEPDLAGLVEGAAVGGVGHQIGVEQDVVRAWSLFATAAASCKAQAEYECSS